MGRLHEILDDDSQSLKQRIVNQENNVLLVVLIAELYFARVSQEALKIATQSHF